MQDQDTSAEAPTHDRSRRGRLRRLLGRGLELNALALMATTGITGVFGLVFWGAAVRYPASEVGRASALISTALMMSVLASMAVGLMFGRFLGVAGARARSMVLLGYAVTAGLAAVISAVFVLFLAQDALFTSPDERWLFPVMVVILALFALQDWVLIGLRQSRWIPVEQLVFAAAKLGLVVLFAATMQAEGIVLAWVLPAALAVLVVTPAALRVLGRQTTSSGGGIALPGPRALGAVFAGEYATGAAAVVIPMVIPLIVVARLGTEANAYYALPWLISEAFMVLLWNISSSYITEASNDAKHGPALLRRAFRLSCLVGLVGTPFLLFAGPVLLSVLGGAFAAEGTTLLRLMAAALPFTALYSSYVAVARVRHQMGRVVALQALGAVIVVGGSLSLIDSIGIAAVGVAYLSMAVLSSLIVAVPLVRALRDRDRPEFQEERADKRLAGCDDRPGQPG